MNPLIAPVSAREGTTSGFEQLLVPDTLSALMRSTWTWDDRALRRDLAQVLVALDAARAVAASDDTAPGIARAQTLQMRALSSAAGFVATVLGPKLIADTGNQLRGHFVAYAVDGADFDRASAAALAAVRDDSPAYLTARARDTVYPSSSTWMELVRTSGDTGLGAAMRAYGQSLSEDPFYGSVGLAWQTLRAIDRDSGAAAAYADQIAAESISATLAAAEQTGSWDPALVRTRAVETPDGWALTGIKQFVLAADAADVLFVIARSTAGPSLFAVNRVAPGLTVTPLDVIDTTRPLWQVELADTPATLLGREGSGGRLMMRAIDLATTALAAEQVGLIETAMGMLTCNLSESLDYRSGVAEMALDHVVATALWQRALTGDSAESASAHVGCSAAAVRAATTAARLLGPSAETDALLRRALSGGLLFGGPALSHERLLERLGV